MNIRKVMAMLLALILTTLFVAPVVPVSASSSCSTVTVVNQNHTSLTTAAVVATSGTTVTGAIDASGCQIGVFVPATATGVTISGATIHDANNYGVFVDGDSGVPGGPNATGVTVSGDTIYNIGNHLSSGAFSPNGVQTGIGIYFSNGATGSVTGNTVYNYQKGGIDVFDFSGPVSGNTVTGLGPVKFIAANGIQLGFPQSGYFFPASNVAGVTGNTVSQNIYTEGGTAGGRPYVSTGILAYVSSGTEGQTTSALASSNTAFNNQCDVCVSVG